MIVNEYLRRSKSWGVLPVSVSAPSPDRVLFDLTKCSGHVGRMRCVTRGHGEGGARLQHRGAEPGLQQVGPEHVSMGGGGGGARGRGQVS